MLFNWHTGAGNQTEYAYQRGPKKQRTELILSKGNPNLECANSGKSILKCLSCLGSLLTSTNFRPLLVTN